MCEWIRLSLKLTRPLEYTRPEQCIANGTDPTQNCAVHSSMSPKAVAPLGTYRSRFRAGPRATLTDSPDPSSLFLPLLCAVEFGLLTTCGSGYCSALDPFTMGASWKALRPQWTRRRW